MKIEPQGNAQVARLALEGTKWSPALTLCQSRFSIAYCGTTEMAKLVKLMKKMPQYILLGLILDNNLLHKADIDKFSAISADIQQLRSQVCNTLSSSGVNVSQSLTHVTSSLVHNLSTYVDAQSPKEGENK